MKTTALITTFISISNSVLHTSSAFSPRPALTSSSSPSLSSSTSQLQQEIGRRTTYSPECEFKLSSPVEDSEIRSERKEHEREASGRYETGEKLGELRESICNMRENLQFSIAAKCSERIASLSEAIDNAEKRDPEVAYAKLLLKQNGAKKNGNNDKVVKLEEEANEARQLIDHFNLHGLWVGKFRDDGYQMINVTYQEDLLIATKVAGNGTIAIGEEMMRVDLCPITPAGHAKAIEEITISEGMAAQFGSATKLNRYPGKGVVPGRLTLQHGHLVAVGDFLSFAWHPSKPSNHVFFGRPELDLAFHLFTEFNSGYKSVGDLSHISRCFDVDSFSGDAYYDSESFQ